MTLPESILCLVSRFEVRARVVACEFDPAGNTTEYAPHPEDISVISVLAGREVGPNELAFTCGGYSGERFCLTAPIIAEIRQSLVGLTIPERGGAR